MTDAEIVELALRRTANRLQTWDTRMADFLTFTADEIAKMLNSRRLAEAIAQTQQ